MNMSTVLETMPSAVEITALQGAEFDDVLAPDALRFIEQLHNKFEDRRQALLRARVQRQSDLDKGIFPEFNPESTYIRTSRWQVAPVKDELKDRRIELIGSVDAHSIIEGLNSEAHVFVADFEDYTSPTWANLMDGQRNLMEAIHGTLSKETEEGRLQMSRSTTAIFVRPRGLHLEEKHIRINNTPVAASLVDFGLFFYHNAARLIDKGSAPYFYLPKIESHNEARWWNQVFMFAQYHMGIPQGTIKASVLIENILAAFEMHEILYEIRDHSAGLSFGKWDYIFSFIRKFRKYTSLVLPDRGQLSMKSPFLNALQRLLIDTCHRRNTVAIGGSSSFVLVDGEEKQNKTAIAGLRKEKRQEILAGHDGTWLTNPVMIDEVMQEFEMHMEGVDQKHVQFEEFQIQAEDMMTLPLGKITEVGIRRNITTSLLYLHGWLAGSGAQHLFQQLEHTATIEIARAQLWQWVHNTAKMDDGRAVCRELYHELKEAEIMRVREMMGEDFVNTPAFQHSLQTLDTLVLAQDFPEFFTHASAMN